VEDITKRKTRQTAIATMDLITTATAKPTHLMKDAASVTEQIPLAGQPAVKTAITLMDVQVIKSSMDIATAISVEAHGIIVTTAHAAAEDIT